MLYGEIRNITVLSYLIFILSDVDNLDGIVWCILVSTTALLRVCGFLASHVAFHCCSLAHQLVGDQLVATF